MVESGHAFEVAAAQREEIEEVLLDCRAFKAGEIQL